MITSNIYIDASPSFKADVIIRDEESLLPTYILRVSDIDGMVTLAFHEKCQLDVIADAILTWKAKELSDGVTSDIQC